MQSEDLRIAKLRPYLSVVARQQVPEHLRSKFDSSDVVQDTLLQIHRSWERLEQLTEQEQKAYNHRVLTNKLVDRIRRYKLGKRRAEIEVSIHAGVQDTSSRLVQWVAADPSSPSDRAMQREEVSRLCAAIENLPVDQRTAVELCHLRGLTLAEAAEVMEKSKQSVAGLLRRGVKRLRETLKE